MHIHTQHTLNIMNASCFFIRTLTKWDKIHTLNNAALYFSCDTVNTAMCFVHAYQSNPSKWINYKDFIKRMLCDGTHMTVYIHTVCRLIVIVVNVLPVLFLTHTLAVCLCWFYVRLFSLLFFKPGTQFRIKWKPRELHISQQKFRIFFLSPGEIYM